MSSQIQGVDEKIHKGFWGHNISSAWYFIAILSIVSLWLHPNLYTMPLSMQAELKRPKPLFWEHCTLVQDF